MALRKILLQGLRLKNKVPVHGPSIGHHRWIHRASTAGWRLALHVCASRGGGCSSQTSTGWAACPGRPQSNGQHKGPALRNHGLGCCPGARGESQGVLGRTGVRWLAGRAQLVLRRKRLLEDLGDRQQER